MFERIKAWFNPPNEKHPRDWFEGWKAYVRGVPFDADHNDEWRSGWNAAYRSAEYAKKRGDR